MNGNRLGPLSTGSSGVPTTGYGELLRNRRFVLFQLSATAAGVGYSVYSIAVPWLALQLSGNLVVVGLVLFVEYGVYTLTFLVAPFVDRARNKRSIFVVCYPSMALAAALIGVAMGDRFLSTFLLLGLVGLISFLWDFAWAADNVVPRLLLAPDQLFRAGGFAGLLGGATQVGGYAAGGVLIVLVGPAGGMFLYAALLAVATGFAVVVSLPVPAVAVRSYWSDFRDGWTHFARGARHALGWLGTAELVRGFFTAAPALLITLVASRILGGSTSGYSLLFAAWVTGGVAVGLVLGELNPRRRVGRILVASLAAEGSLVLGAVLFAPSVLLGAILWASVGASGTAYLTARYAFLAGAYPPETLGRVTANLYVFTGTASSAGALVLGGLAGTASVGQLGAVVAAGLLLAGALVAVLPGLRGLSF